MTRFHAYLGLASALTYHMPAYAAAQEPAPETSVGDRAPIGSEDIVVTARKRSESLLETPISITAISGVALEKAGISQLSDVARQIPNFYMDSNPTASRIAIRGIGTVGGNPSFEQTVGLSIDGVYFGRQRWFEVGAFDVEQIEVLRGPQGVYFGKNTTAGLVNIRTRGPGDRWEASIRAGYEFRLDERVLEGAAGGPVTDNFGLRIAVQNIASEGFVRNIALGSRDPAGDSTIARLSAEWNPIDVLSLVYKGQYSRSKIGSTSELGECSAALRAQLTAAGGLEDCTLNRRRTAGRSIPGGFQRAGEDINRNESWSQGLTASLELGEFTVTSVTGLQGQKASVIIDADYTDLPVLEFGRREQHDQFSQEFRILSPSGRFFQFVAGAYYEHAKLIADDVTDFNAAAFTALPVTGSNARSYRQKSNSYALFGEATFNISDSFRVTAGGRYTRESKRVALDFDLGSFGNPLDDSLVARGQFALLGFTEVHTSGRRSENNFSPAVAVQWDITPDVHAYASYKKGFKAGGFDSGVSSQLPSGEVQSFEFQDEDVRAIEVGLKFRALDNRLRISTALFHTKFSDLQVTAQTDFAQMATLNAANVTSEGGEAEIQFTPISGLNLNLAGGYTDARYDKFTNAPCFALQTVAQGCVARQQDLTGKRLALAPKWQTSVGFDWRTEVSEQLALTVAADANYRDRVWLQLDHEPSTLENSLWLLNGRIELSDIDNRWSVSLVGANLLNEQYRLGVVQSSLYPRSFGAPLGRPRTVQLQLSYKL